MVKVKLSKIVSSSSHPHVYYYPAIVLSTSLPLTIKCVLSAFKMKVKNAYYGILSIVFDTSNEVSSVWPEKSPNVYKSCPEMISQEK